MISNHFTHEPYTSVIRYNFKLHFLTMLSYVSLVLCLSRKSIQNYPSITLINGRMHRKTYFINNPTSQYNFNCGFDNNI